jgi:TRAP-type C4-dicarboxylate transport system substrate-binding protein
MRLTRTLTAWAAVAVLLGVSSVAGAEEAVLRTQTALPRNHDLSKSFLKNFVDRVNEVGKGVVRIDYKGGPEVTPVKQAASALKRGVFDILHSPAAYHIGIVPEGLALMSTNLTPPEFRANGAFAMLAPHWEEKLNAKILAVGETGAQFYLYTVDKPALKDGVVDFTGVKMRSTGAYRPLLTKLHATLVQIPAGEVYTGLQRGVIGGFGWPSVGLQSQGLAKVVKYRIDPPFYHLANLVLINQDKWKSLSKEAQAVLTKVAAEYEKSSVDYMHKAGEADAAAVAKEGVQVFHMSPEGAKKYLAIAYDAMWGRAKSKLSAEEYAALRAKLYKQ